VNERLRLIALVNESDESFATLCQSLGISRKTEYKWVARYEALGPSGLDDRTSARRVFAHATPAAVVDALLELRKEHPRWGPKKLCARLITLGVEHVPAASTVGDLLRKHGLIRPRRRRVFPPKSPSKIHVTEYPNDTWCIDFKGHFSLGDKTRCHPLTMTDEHTRYLLKCEGLLKTDSAHVRVHVERAFREFGLPLRIRSDNGPPFASAGIGGLSALSVWWVQLGIFPERIEPGCAQQNGRHERMHRTLKDEAASPPAPSRHEQQRQLDRFRHVYNDERPHEGLGQKTPSSKYTSSRRVMPDRVRELEYPDTVKPRRLDDHGRLHFRGTKTLVSPLLKSQLVGIEEVENEKDEGQHWRLHYGPVALAEMTLRDKVLRFEKAR